MGVLSFNTVDGTWLILLHVETISGQRVGSDIPVNNERVTQGGDSFFWLKNPFCCGVGGRVI